MKRFSILVKLLVVIAIIGGLLWRYIALSEYTDIRWVYQSSPIYRNLYVREAAVCKNMVLVSPVSVSPQGEYYPFINALDLMTGAPLWTATVGGHVMCIDEGVYVLDDHSKILRKLTYAGEVQKGVYVPVSIGRFFANTDLGIAVLEETGNVAIWNFSLTSSTSFSTPYSPYIDSMLVTDGRLLFWKTTLDGDYAVVSFDLTAGEIRWVKKMNVHKFYVMPYGEYLFVSGFEKFYVVDKYTGNIARSYSVAYYEPYIVASNNRILIPRDDWLDVFSKDDGLLVRVYRDSDMAFSAYSIAGSRIVNVDSDDGKAYACTLTEDLSCIDRKTWVFPESLVMGDKVYGTGVNFVVPVEGGWLVFLTYRTIPPRYINGYEIIFLDDEGVSPTNEWETPFGGPDADGRP